MGIMWCSILGSLHIKFHSLAHRTRLLVARIKSKYYFSSVISRTLNNMDRARYLSIHTQRNLRRGWKSVSCILVTKTARILSMELWNVTKMLSYAAQNIFKSSNHVSPTTIYYTRHITLNREWSFISLVHTIGCSKVSNTPQSTSRELVDALDSLDTKLHW